MLHILKLYATMTRPLVLQLLHQSNMVQLIGKMQYIQNIQNILQCSPTNATRWVNSFVDIVQQQVSRGAARRKKTYAPAAAVLLHATSHACKLECDMHSRSGVRMMLCPPGKGLDHLLQTQELVVLLWLSSHKCQQQNQHLANLYVQLPHPLGPT